MVSRKNVIQPVQSPSPRHREQTRVVLVSPRFEIGGQIQERRRQQSPVDKQQHNQESPDATIAVNELVDGTTAEAIVESSVFKFPVHGYYRDGHWLTTLTKENRQGPSTG